MDLGILLKGLHNIDIIIYDSLWFYCSLFFFVMFMIYDSLYYFNIKLQIFIHLFIECA